MSGQGAQVTTIADLFQTYARALRTICERKGLPHCEVEKQVEAARYSFMAGIHSFWDLMQKTIPTDSLFEAIAAEITEFAQEARAKAKQARPEGAVH